MLLQVSDGAKVRWRFNSRIETSSHQCVTERLHLGFPNDWSEHGRVAGRPLPSHQYRLSYVTVVRAVGEREGGIYIAPVVADGLVAETRLMHSGLHSRT